MDRLKELYFIWLMEHVCDINEMKKYRSLLHVLFNEDYIYDNHFDENMAVYGVALREIFYKESHAANRLIDRYGTIDDPCNLLEMMISLSICMEEQIMSNDAFGDRTSVWFWDMIDSLGLLEMDESHFDEVEIYEILDNFTRKRYKIGKKGSLFIIKNTGKLQKRSPIWHQAMSYLTEKSFENGEI